METASEAPPRPTDAMHVERIPGQLPPFWERSVVFFANLLSLFYGNREGREDLRRQVSGLDTYGGRLVPVLDLVFRGGHNLLFLERAPDATLVEYFRGMLGLGLPEVEVLPNGTAELGRILRDDPGHPLVRKTRNRRAYVDGFVTDDALEALARDLGLPTLNTPETSKHGNNKYLLHRHLEALGLPVFDTRTAGEREELPARLAELRALGYERAAVKAQIGASGVGLFHVSTEPGAPLDVPDHVFHEGPVLVQGWMGEDFPGQRRIGSPSVQLFLDDTTVWLFDVTDQILSEASVHEGNVSPPPWTGEAEGAVESLLDQAEVAGRWLHGQGYRGTASTDFLLVEREGRLVPYVCEINARVTGATYPSVLARRFRPGAAWAHRNLRFRERLEGARLLDALEQAGVLFHPDRDVPGILPINFNLDGSARVTKGQFLVLGPNGAACEEALRRAGSVLPLEWAYDRD